MKYLFKGGAFVKEGNHQTFTISQMMRGMPESGRAANLRGFSFTPYLSVVHPKMGIKMGIKLALLSTLV